MLCERCKIREANIQYTEVVNGVKTEHHFCAQCAKEMDFGPYAAIFDSEFPLGKLLSGLLGIGEDQEEKKAHQVICPACKTTYEDFIQNSRFGCPECYGVFDLLIGENIKQLQGSDCHKGKRPVYQGNQGGEVLQEHAERETEAGKDNREEQIRAWNRKLKEALRMEEYETAAVCRDKIRELKEGKEADA